jgi:hypothetical protein
MTVFKTSGESRLERRTMNGQLHAPRRVKALGTFSVLMMDIDTDDRIQSSGVVNLASGLLRHRCGCRPKNHKRRDAARSGGIIDLRKAA